MKHRLFTLLFLQLVSLALFAGTVTTYPAPSGAPLNDDFTVRVRATDGLWQTVNTYAWNVDHTNNGRHTIEKSSVAYFDFTDKVEVEVTWNKGDVKTARVRPLSKNIATTLHGNTVCFSLNRPLDLSVEVNGDTYHNLQLFANAAIPVYKNAGQVCLLYTSPSPRDRG